MYKKYIKKVKKLENFVNTLRNNGYDRVFYESPTDAGKYTSHTIRFYKGSNKFRLIYYPRAGAGFYLVLDKGSKTNHLYRDPKPLKDLTLKLIKRYTR